MISKLIEKYKSQKTAIEGSIAEAKAAGRREMTLDTKDKVDKVISRGEARIKVIDEAITDLEMLAPQKVLTIIKTTYGGSERPVIMLDYGNHGERPTFEIIRDDVDMELLQRMAYAAARGFTIQFKGFDVEEKTRT